MVTRGANNDDDEGDDSRSPSEADRMDDEDSDECPYLSDPDREDDDGCRLADSDGETLVSEPEHVLDEGQAHAKNINFQNADFLFFL